MKTTLLKIYDEDGELRIEYQSRFLAVQGISKGALSDDEFAEVLLGAVADYFSCFPEGEDKESLADFVEAVLSLIPKFRKKNKELRAMAMIRLGAS